MPSHPAPWPEVGAGGTLGPSGQDAPSLVILVATIPKSQRPASPWSAALVGVALALGTLVGTAGAAGAEQELAVERWEGADRYETAAAVAAEAFTPDEVDEVYVASGRDFADALAGGPAAAAADAPILLTEPGALPASTQEAIEELAPDRITLLGGPAAVDTAVEDRLGSLADTRRLPGEDRFATAAAIAADAFDAAEVDRVYLATGEEFADALAGGAAAAAAGAPILLSGDSLPQASAEQLDAFSPDEVVVLGGTAAVPAIVASEAAEAASIEEAERLWSSDRFGTAAEIAMASFGAATTDRAYVAASDGFADALAAVPAAARDGAPLLLAEPTVPFPPAPPAALGPIGGLTVEEVRVLGGFSAVNEGLLHELDTARVPTSPREPAKLELLAPDRVVADERFTIDVVVTDTEGAPVPGAGAHLAADEAAVAMPLRAGADGVARVGRTLDPEGVGGWRAWIDDPDGELTDVADIEVVAAATPEPAPDGVEAVADCEAVSTGEPGAVMAFPSGEGPGWDETVGPPVNVGFVGCGAAGFEASLQYLLWHEDDRRPRHAGGIQAGGFGQWERFEFAETLQRSGEWRVEVIELNAGWPLEGDDRWFYYTEQTFTVD